MKYVYIKVIKGPKRKSLENQLLKSRQRRGSPDRDREKMIGRHSMYHNKVLDHRNTERRVISSQTKFKKKKM